jgi:hypothetical protein
MGSKASLSRFPQICYGLLNVWYVHVLAPLGYYFEPGCMHTEFTYFLPSAQIIERGGVRIGVLIPLRLTSISRLIFRAFPQI